MFDVEVVSFVPLDKILESLSKHEAVANYNEIMGAAVPALGDGWAMNFRNQGARVGGWKPLSEYTQQVRQNRGYNAEHPILRQSSALYKGAVMPFQRWHVASARFSKLIQATPTAGGSRRQESYGSKSGGSYRGEGGRGQFGEVGYSGESAVNAYVLPRQFVAHITGAKALNQTGGPMVFPNAPRGYVNVPARPFWFFDSPMLDEAAKKIADRFTFRIFEGMPGKL